LRTGDTDRARGDFNRAIGIDREKMSAHIGVSDCARAEKKYGEAIKGYSYVISNSNGSLKTSMMIKRAHCHIELKKYELASQDIDAVR